LIKENLPPDDQVPPPFADLLKLPDLVDSLELHEGFNPRQSMAIVQAVDGDAAAKIQRIVRNGISNAKQLILLQVANEMQSQSPAMQDAMAKYANRIAALFQKHLEPDVQGEQLIFDFVNENSVEMTQIATVGVLVGMLLPAVQAVREAARRTAAANTLRQFALACLNYESAYGHFPAQANFSDDGKSLLSWRVHILPFIEEQALYQQFALDEPWDSPHNIKLLDKMPEIFRSPNSRHTNKTVYLGISGAGTIFDGGQKGTKLSQITDGTSNTILLVEANDEAAVEWTRPADYELDQDNPLWGLGGMRPGGFNAVFADGSARFVALETDPEMIIRMMLKADGKPLEDY
jgi:prepilin-type processing-associated H-X9-DG protein